LCHAHYQRWRTTGEVSPERPIEEAGRAWEARFWALVARSDQPGACWLWLGHINPNGYAQWQIAKTSKAELVHRIAYRLMYGEIDQTLQLDHLCKIRHCVNPDHLEQVTAKENNMRSTSPTAFNRLKTHCKYGHPFDVTNTLYRPNGGRACRLCKKLRRRRR